MMRRVLEQWSVLFLTLVSFTANALDFRAVNQAAPLFASPAAKTPPTLLILAGTPVEVVLVAEGWCKIRNSKGELLWIESRFLSAKRQVIVRNDLASVRATADEKASVVFDAERDVTLELLETPLETAKGGWVKVRHRDGATGFILAAQVWGL